MAISLTRRVASRPVPAPGIWEIDATHSQLEFVARHLMIAKVRGRFRSFAGWVEIGEEPLDSRVEVVIEADSIDTGDVDRDIHLRTPDFLDVAHHPTLVYRSTGVRPVDPDRWAVAGELTLRGVTRSVEVTASFTGAAEDPWGNARAAFQATAYLDREAFGITWNHVLEAGRLLVGRTVEVEAGVETLRSSEGSERDVLDVG
jgi:polyisoprenoid-binding protein YceI